jgi:hypothetical protein
VQFFRRQRARRHVYVLGAQDAYGPGSRRT